MNARLRLLAACTAALLGAAAHAQDHIKPGLWESTVSMKSDNPAFEQMKARLAAMPPEQRAQMEKMMAGHGMGMGADGSTMRVCVTKEQIARGFHPEDKGHCSRSNVSTSGNVTKFDFACQSERSTVTGHGAFTEMGDTAFNVVSSTEMVSEKRTMHMQSEINGKFVSSDCGDVKPIEPPPAK